MNQKMSGLYKGVPSTTSKKREKQTELELRVDVDGANSLNIISGDVYTKSNNTRRYLNSFIFKGIKKTKTPTNRILLIGNNGKFSSNLNKFTNIKISIFTNTHNHPTATFEGTNSSTQTLRYLCRYVSKYFRTVQLEHDHEKGVIPLEPYEITNSTSPSPHRTKPISMISAFAEAGIKIIVVKEKMDSVSSPKGTPISKGVWTDNELFEAMQKHFRLLKKDPQWKLWLLSAKEYVMSNIYGISTDRKEKKRRGCAVFQNSTGWQTSEEKRFRLYIYIHELGHCFNLHHPWNKPKTEQSSKMEGYASLSWMNLPWRYYSSEECYGEEAFWKAFEFQFDRSELIHLRHGFRNDVIFGGRTFNNEIETKSTTKGATTNGPV